MQQPSQPMQLAVSCSCRRKINVYTNSGLKLHWPNTNINVSVKKLIDLCAPKHIDFKPGCIGDFCLNGTVKKNSVEALGVDNVTRGTPQGDGLILFVQPQGTVSGIFLVREACRN